MYKKTYQSRHYLPREGSYSTHPKRNGRVDVLPVGAQEALYDTATQIEDGEYRLQMLKIERDSLAEKLQFSRGVHRLQAKHVGAADSKSASAIHVRLQEVDQEIGQVRKHVGGLRSLLKGGGAATFDEAFVRVARAELAAEVYEALTLKAHRVLAAATGRSTGGGK